TRRVHVLTGHLEHSKQVAAADRHGLEDPPFAQEYMFHADAWTTASSGRELALNSVDDIPWWEFPDDARQAEVEDVKQAFASRIEPLALYMAFPLRGCRCRPGASGATKTAASCRWADYRAAAPMPA